MKTLLLNPQTWDLTLDNSGNVAVASDPDSLAQDAASAIRLVRSELWYDTTQGVPYFAAVLGFNIPLPLLKETFVAAALTVPGVASAKVFISAIVDRKVSGQVQVTPSAGGAPVAANF